MRLKRIIISALVTAIVFYAASWLTGDGGYIRELAVTSALRGELTGVVSALKERGDLTLDVQVRGDTAYRGVVLDAVSKFGGLTPGSASANRLTVSIEEEDGRVTTSLDLKSGGEELASGSRTVRVGDWTSLLPPLLAIILAICLRRVLTSLALAIWLGAALSYSVNPAKSAWYALSHYIWGNFIGEFSLMILGFVFVLIGMVNIINRGGGIAGVVGQITRIAKNARTACVSAACMGVMIFFDDYTNTIVVGTTMRSFTDRMRVSREKLAYIVDSTSAPLAGLAVISTWIGFEVLQLHSVGEFLGVGLSGYALFLHALPFRFYCIYAIAFVFIVSIMRRDFGPMLTAERRAAEGQVVDLDPDALHSAEPMLKAADPKPGAPERWYNAVIPVLSVLTFLVIGIFWRGSQLVEHAGLDLSLMSFENLRECFVRIGGDGNTLFALMLGGAGFGTIVASALMLGQRILSFKDIAKAFLSGWRIIPAAAILILAWAIREVCDDLGTALFLSSLLKGTVDPLLLPVVIFLLSSAVAFATGTSFGAMGLLLPTVAPLAYTLGSPAVFFMSLGSVLDGAIFGDHCSPISDTTVLSSISSSCDLSDHVRTQMPYAILCMIVAVVCGYLPAAYGIAPWWLYGAGLGLLAGVLLLIGRNPEKRPSLTPASSSS